MRLLLWNIYEVTSISFWYLPIDAWWGPACLCTQEVSQIVAYQRGCWCWDWTSLLGHYFSCPSCAHRSVLRSLQYPKTLDDLETLIASARSGLPCRSHETGPIAFQYPYPHDEHMQTRTVLVLFQRNHVNPDLVASPAIEWLPTIE